MIIVLARIESSADDIANLRQAIIDMEKATANEPGSISYAFVSEISDPNFMRVIEHWETMDALKAHFLTPHMADFQKAMAGYPPKSVDVKVYDIAKELPFPAM
ncbi:MAG: quinol monooxygenase YgiN [Oceanicoccus sp.]|jgi:quinol monooxygenase YgiN